MAVTAISPLAPARFPTLPAVGGIELGAVPAALRYEGRHDLMLAHFAEGTVGAGIFTANQVQAAPVVWSKACLASGASVRALVVNAGNANAMTGSRGHRTAEATAECAADLLKIDPREVWLASTGVIGEIMAPGPIRKGLSRLAGGLSATLYRDAAEAIRTTDTFPKAASRTVKVNGQTVTINGIAKGSGMIEPNMATMLGFVFTDANLSADVLNHVLRTAADTSFHAITVDGDTSTNDCVMAFATGAVKGAEITSVQDPQLDVFVDAFESVMIELAQQIVRDGEGAQKFVSVTVSGTQSDRDARKIAKTIANSPLVKTAIAGEDPNWGRIAMAAGRAGVAFDPCDLWIKVGGVLAAHNGAVHMRYPEEDAAAHMKGDHVDLDVGVGKGEGAATVWTTDLTHGYIDINADYRS